MKNTVLMLITTIFALTSHIANSQPINNENAQKLLFNDLDIMVNQENNGYSFGQIIALKDLISSNNDLSVEPIKGRGDEGMVFIMKTSYGEENALALKMTEFKYHNEDVTFTSSFFHYEPGTFGAHILGKYYFGKKNDFRIKPNIYKVISVYNSGKSSDSFYKKIASYTKNQFVEKGYVEWTMEQDSNRYDYSFIDYMVGQKFNFSLLYGSMFINKQLANRTALWDDIKIPAYLLNIGKNSVEYNGVLRHIIYVEISAISDNIFDIYTDINDKYIIKGRDLREVNTYQLGDMISVFLDDCELNGIKIIRNQKITTEFVELEGNTLAIAYGVDDDSKIIVAVDPVKWDKAPLSNKWYTIYHELGHDILNLRHGDGGEMMFNFANQNYSWKEFIEDKEFMFEIYKVKTGQE